jgi:catabolite regulation protein CreA
MVTLLVIAVFGAILVLRPQADPLEVVAAFTASRNAGDVDAAMDLLADDASIFGGSIADPKQRNATRQILAAQALAGWTIVDSDCEATEEASDVSVICRYQMDDEILRRWELSFTGTHEYTVRDGKIAKVTRVHDLSSRDRAYAALGAFRAWVTEAHPDLVVVIWSDPQGVTYATPEGARAMLDLLDEYEESRSGVDKSLGDGWS